MPRAKTGVVRRRRHKKILKRAKGYWGSRSKLFKNANQTLLNAADYAFRDRRDKKKDIRRLWIVRINAAAREEGMTYSTLISGLRKANVNINRKVMADLAVHEPDAFRQLIEVARAA